MSTATPLMQRANAGRRAGPSWPIGRILPRSFHARSVHDVARDLLGMTLVRALPAGRSAPERLAGRIVEGEAYDGPQDLACHASKGRTHRIDVMFGDAGHAYL